LSIETLATRLLAAVEAIARGAGERILEVYALDFAVTRKADDSPVTAADTRADAYIREHLTRLEPSLPVLSEESRVPPLAERRGWETFWLVDPLDGTRGFVRRSGEFVVSIALVHAHRPVLGVIHAPVRARTYSAARGAGAWRSERGERQRIRTRRCPRGAPTVAASRSRRDPRTRRLLAALGASEVLRVGSALKSCLVAEGRADLYPGFGETSEWDTAAGQCLVEEAGGAMVDLEGLPLRYNRAERLINPPFLAFGDPARDWLRHVRAERAGGR